MENICLIILKSSLNILSINKTLNTEYAFFNTSHAEFQYALKKFILSSLNVSSTCQTQPGTLKNYLIKYIYPILIIFGVISNLFCLVALLKINRTTKKANRNFTLCLATLCFCDLNMILFACGREYLEAAFDIPLRLYSVYACKSLFFACYLFSSFASYLYAYIAFERWFAISKPIKYKQTKNQYSRVRILYIFLFCVSISFPFLLFSTIKEVATPLENIKKTCDLSGQYYVHLTILDAFLYCFVPFLITLSFSSSTLVILVYKSRFRSLNMSSTGNASNVSNHSPVVSSNVKIKKNLNTVDGKSTILTFRYSKSSNTHIHNSKGSTLKITKENNLNAMQKLYPQSIKENILSNEPSSLIEGLTLTKSVETKRWSDFKTTIMLMTLPFSYLVVTFPVFVIITLTFIKHDHDKALNEYETAFVFFKTIMHLNNSFNILFFIFFGKTLRNDLKKIVQYMLHGNNIS